MLHLTKLKQFDAAEFEYSQTFLAQKQRGFISSSDPLTSNVGDNLTKIDVIFF